ncbi:MAG TPA: PrgI family protein [Clostridiaceae bacterium]|jgi:hypothetical protein|nr:PrgI family protein [Clostridiaceae bacterium]
MAYVTVPKDLNKVKTKVALNLTKRQLICFSAAGLVGVPVYLLTRSTLGNDVAATLMVMIMLPLFAFALYEKDGMTLEKIIGNMVRSRFFYPKRRPYETENVYRIIQNEINERKEAARHAKKKRRAQAAFARQAGRANQTENH